MLAKTCTLEIKQTSKYLDSNSHSDILLLQILATVLNQAKTQIDTTKEVNLMNKLVISWWEHAKIYKGAEI